jgi:TPR repeat protein
VVRSKDTETIAWIKRGAQQGNVLAKFNLGGAYLKGNGVSRDTIEAYKWLFLAADNGHNDARVISNALAKKMDARAVVKAQELANNWQVDFSKTSKWRR